MWILIIKDCYEAGIAIHSLEFPTKEGCEEAAAKIKRVFGSSCEVVCMEKK